MFCITDWYFYKYVKFEMKRNRYNLVHRYGVLCIPSCVYLYTCVYKQKKPTCILTNRCIKTVISTSVAEINVQDSVITSE